jgi:hypothetical protein
MITKGIVEEIISPNEIRVRLPVYDRAKDTSSATKTEDLTVAAVCGLPNCYNYVDIGDVVFVGFEDNTTYRAVILGHLITGSAERSPTVQASFSSLNVTGNTSLSQNTSIGDVSADDVHQLLGIKDNIQKQLDFLNSKIDALQSAFDELTKER